MRTATFLCAVMALSAPVFAKDYSALFERLSPAVVTIHTKQTTVTRNAQSVSTGGLGTGVVIAKDGTILTASHVVNKANTVWVELKDGSTHSASVLSSIPAADLAIIKINSPPKDLVVVKPGNSDRTKIGSDVFVIGAPYGLKHTFTAGNLSGRRTMEQVYLGDDLEFLQTDAPINQGNSGGPLFSGKGELIGIVSHIKSKSGGNEGLGFAASINMADRLILNQPPIWFGLEFLTLNRSSLEMLNVSGYEMGLLVQSVAKGSIGAGFGVRAGSFPITIQDQRAHLGGDIIVEVGGGKFGRSRESLARIKNYFVDYQTSLYFIL